MRQVDENAGICSYPVSEFEKNYGLDRHSEYRNSRCRHSKEAILMLLAQSPQRYKVNEIAALTGLHRNTASRKLSELVQEGAILKNGDSYQAGGVPKHYRRIVKTLTDLDVLDLTEEQTAKLLHKFAKRLVINSVAEVLKQDPDTDIELDKTIEIDGKAGGLSLKDLEHVRMAYPFKDIFYADVFEEDHETGMKTDKIVGYEIKRNVAIARQDKEDICEIHRDHNFDLYVFPCICQGKKDQEHLCNLVAGALEGAIRATCAIETDVSIIPGTFTDEKYGQYCAYNVKTKAYLERLEQETMEKPLVNE